MKNYIIDKKYICQNCEDTGFNLRYIGMCTFEPTPCTICNYGKIIKENNIYLPRMISSLLNSKAVEYTKRLYRELFKFTQKEITDDIKKVNDIMEQTFENFDKK